jgi:hypothetical protein
MNSSDFRSILTASTMTMLFVSAVGCEVKVGKRADVIQAQAQVRQIVDELDKRTTETGVYIRVKDGEIDEKDPWGTTVRIAYSQGGIAEVISVRSAGPDRKFHTDDDEVAESVAANFKGVGEGIKNNAGETAANVAKGVVKGTVDGVKRTIKESLPFKKEKASDIGPKKDDSTGQ